MSTFTKFDYLLNAMENAARQQVPFDHGYGDKRRAVLQYVAALEKDAARYRAIRRGQRWSVINGIVDTLRAEGLDEAIDAAIAAQKAGSV